MNVGSGKKSVKVAEEFYTLQKNAFWNANAPEVSMCEREAAG